MAKRKQTIGQTTIYKKAHKTKEYRITVGPPRFLFELKTEFLYILADLTRRWGLSCA
jgi:hypothetical protein